MPIRIRWKSKEHIGIALMLLGVCGMFQLIFIFFAQYFLSVGNYLAVVIVPIGVTVSLFFAATIIFESFAQVERRKKLRSQFQKVKSKNIKLTNFINFPIVKPLFLILVIFVVPFVVSYVICIIFLDNIISFIIAENLGTVFCLLVANYIEKSYGRVQRL